jgi:hypothetical protein
MIYQHPSLQLTTVWTSNRCETGEEKVFVWGTRTSASARVRNRMTILYIYVQIYMYSTTNRSVHINKLIRMTELQNQEERLHPNAKTVGIERQNHRSVGDSHRGTFLNKRKRAFGSCIRNVCGENGKFFVVHFHYRYWSIVRWLLESLYTKNNWNAGVARPELLSSTVGEGWDIIAA